MTLQLQLCVLFPEQPTAQTTTRRGHKKIFPTERRIDAFRESDNRMWPKGAVTESVGTIVCDVFVQLERVYAASSTVTERESSLV